jgi:hypothetical protein
VLRKTREEEEATGKKQQDSLHGLKVNPDLLLYDDTGSYLLFNI